MHFPYELKLSWSQGTSVSVIIELLNKLWSTSHDHMSYNINIFDLCYPHMFKFANIFTFCYCCTNIGGNVVSILIVLTSTAQLHLEYKTPIFTQTNYLQELETFKIH